MNILVCIKQVPDTTEIKIDPETNTLIRAGVPSIVNPFDACALEMAVRLKEAVGGKVTVISMGPDQAKNALRECLAVGGDVAYLVSDRVFGGSDTLATSYVLYNTVQTLEEKTGEPFDLIFCGKQAIDGDTAQVGPELAEHLGYPQVTYACDIEATDRSVIVKRNNDVGYERIEAPLPAVVTVTKTSYEPRFPSIKSKMAANRAVIHTLTSADMTMDLTRVGLKGSPTKVKRTFTPTILKNGTVIQEASNAESAVKLIALLCEAKLV